MLVVYCQIALLEKINFAFFANPLGDKPKKIVLVQNINKNRYAYDSDIYPVITSEDQTERNENSHHRCGCFMYFPRCGLS
jgi:hypothetical protein